MLTISRTIVFAAVLLPLAACTSAPQQPADPLDEQTPVAMDNPTSPATPSNTGRPGFDTASTGTIGQSTAASLAALTGKWAAETTSCETPDVTLTATRFESLERACDIGDVVAGGEGSYTVGLRCTGASGEVDGQLVKLSPTDAGMDVTIVGGDSGPQSLVRCP